jgi:hypothetical protein
MPGYRELAERTRFSVSALAAAARGERLPSLKVTLAYVDACGGDREQWKRRWEDLRHRLTEGMADAAEADPPYLALSRYEAGDAGRFFGRDALVDEIVTRTKKAGFVGVFGPSGSGKSSLLRAGVVPMLGMDATVVTPGARGTPPEAEVLVVDQFEELFTLRPDAAARHAFLDDLLGRSGRVIIAVRADFYGRCAEHLGLVAALRDTGVLVGAMRGDELREAIVKPAAAERRTRTLQGLVSALSVLLLVAVGAGALAVSERAEADEQRRLARSRQLAAEALAMLPTDVRGAARRATEAYRTAPTLDARSAVLSIAGHRPYQSRLNGHAGMGRRWRSGPTVRSWPPAGRTAP